MKKTLAIFLTVLLWGNISAGALWKVENTGGICIGQGTVSFTGCGNGEMSLMAEGRSFEETILAGWNDLSEKIDIEAFGITSEEELYNLYCDVIYNNPKYYYIGNEYEYEYTFYEGSDEILIASIKPTYTETDKSVIEDVWEQIDEEASNILLYVENDMTDFEKVAAVHDYMVLHYDYDYTYENHTITIMTTKTGVCESYARAFNYIMKILGVESVMVTSYEMNHAWNLVKVDGKWYHVDVTWDDYGTPDQVGHEFELLSDEKIQSLGDDAHYGYNTGGLNADSNRFDEVGWHSSTAQIVSVNGIDYWVSGNDLVDSNGRVIYSGLDGNDGQWDLGSNKVYRNIVRAGLAEFDGKLYFNTDKAIYSYCPQSEVTELIEGNEGICGLYIDRNIIRYCKRNLTENCFYEVGEIKLFGVRYSVPYVKDNKIIAEVCNSTSENIKVLSFGTDGCTAYDVGEGLSTFEFEVGSDKFMFIWDADMHPLEEKTELPEAN